MRLPWSLLHPLKRDKNRGRQEPWQVQAPWREPIEISLPSDQTVGSNRGRGNYVHFISDDSTKSTSPQMIFKNSLSNIPRLSQVKLESSVYKRQPDTLNFVTLQVARYTLGHDSNNVLFGKKRPG